jgi:copper oxidase (laccase) domain-containing protein
VTDVDLLDWAAPGPYRVAFSTRVGGVSEGSFQSLNLGILTEDDPARVVENRTR